MWFETSPDEMKWKVHKIPETKRTATTRNRTGKNSNLILAIYVDDGVLMSDSIQEMKKLLEELQQEFNMRIVREPKTFIGMELSKTPEGLKITQSWYARKILERFGMEESKPVKTLMVKQDNIQEERYLVRKAIGSLLFLFNKTRPDMSYGVNVCSRYTDKSADKLIINVKRIFRYVQGTRDAGVPYNMNEPDDELVAFSDSDYAGDFETRRSMIGFLIMCRGGPIS